MLLLANSSVNLKLQHIKWFLPLIIHFLEVLLDSKKYYCNLLAAARINLNYHMEGGYYGSKGVEHWLPKNEENEVLSGKYIINDDKINHGNTLFLTFSTCN